MVKKVSKSTKKRSTILLSRAVLERMSIEAKRKNQAIKDLKKLDKEGFAPQKNVFQDSSESKKVVEEKLKKEKLKNPENILLKNVMIKRVQHPNRNIKTYIFVARRNSK